MPAMSVEAAGVRGIVGRGMLIEKIVVRKMGCNVPSRGSRGLVCGLG